MNDKNVCVEMQMTALGIREDQVFLHILPATSINCLSNLFQPRGANRQEQIYLNDICPPEITYWKQTHKAASLLQKLCKIDFKTCWQMLHKNRQ